MRFRLELVRFAFLDIWKPVQAFGAGDFKFRAVGLLDKANTAELARLEDAIHQVAVAKWGGKADAKLAAIRGTNHWPVKDGDKKTYAGYPGNWALGSSHKRAPCIVDEHADLLTEADGKLYSGCYGKLLIDIYAYDDKGITGIGFGLEGLQYLKDGEHFGGGVPATPADFSEVLHEAQAEGIL